MAANEQLDVKVNFNVVGVSEIGKAAKELKGLGKAGSDAEPGIKKATESTFGMNDAIKKLAAGGVLLAAGKALVNFGKQSINTASDIEEMQSKFNTVFKDLSGSVTADLQTFADAANRSVYDLQGFAATLQDTFVPLGFAREEAADMSVQLVKLAEDLASFNNLNTADVVADLQSALVGNTETLRKYGVVANQAAIDQKALELGLEFTKGKMDAQTKSAAILALTLESTTDAQGDAIKTSDSYANQIKGLDAAMTDLQAVVGEALLPAMTDLVEIATQATKQLSIAAGALGGYSKEVENIVSSNIEAAQSMEELVEQGQRIQATYEDAGTAGRLITGTNKAFADSSIDTAIAIAKAAGSFEDYESAIHSAFGGQVEFANILNRSSEYAGKTAYEVYELAKSQQELDIQTQAAGASTGRWAAMAGQAEEALAGVSTETMNASEYADAYTKHLEASTRAIELQKDISAEAARVESARVEAVAKATQEQVAAFRGAASFAEELISAQNDLAESQGEWVSSVRSNAGEIGAISAKLAGDLTNDQKKAYQEILNTVDEGSGEWLSAYDALQNDLSDSQRQALIAQRANLQAAGDENISVYTGDAEAAEDAQERIIAAQQALQESYRQTAFEALLAGAQTSEAFEQAIAAGLETGAITQAQADLQSQIGGTGLKIEELNKALQGGRISTEEYGLAFENLTTNMGASVDGAITNAQSITKAAEESAIARASMIPEVDATAVASTFTEAGTGISDVGTATGELDEASIALNETLGTAVVTTADLQTNYAGITAEMVTLQTEAYGVNEAMGALPKQVDISVNYHTSGSAPTASSGQASGGSRPGFAAGTGGQFETVPPGFPNDSYGIGLSSGEKFMVIPAGGGGNTTNNSSATVNANINVGSPNEYVDPLKQALRETGIRGF